MALFNLPVDSALQIISLFLVTKLIFLILAKSYDKINKNEKAYENFSKMNQLSFQNKRSKISK